MLDEEELQALADDIASLGLLHPVVLDDEGRVLDGRNRLKACEIAGIEPRYTTYKGDRPDLYALSVNARRRNLTKGQLAMIAAKACSLGEQAARSPREQASCSPREQTARALSEQTGVSLTRIGLAGVVLRHAPDLVDPVINGAISLNEAYKVARENKNQADSFEAQLERLRAQDPELADRVVEGDLGLTAAWTECKEREEEEIRQRKIATQFLCEVVVPLAQARGTNTFKQFDAEYVLPGRSITQEVIEQAAQALAELATAWQERDLP